jgi:hypothetical protein
MSEPRARIGALLAYPFTGALKLGRGMLELQHRERLRLQRELSATQRLMPLLMKQRNGESWNEEERGEIRAQLHRMAEISPYLVLFVMPGGLFLLPLLAWWLDRRRQQRRH